MFCLFFHLLLPLTLAMKALCTVVFCSLAKLARVDGGVLSLCEDTGEATQTQQEHSMELKVL